MQVTMTHVMYDVAKNFKCIMNNPIPMNLNVKSDILNDKLIQCCLFGKLSVPKEGKGRKYKLQIDAKIIITSISLHRL